jgi:hypothetical protein
MNGKNKQKNKETIYIIIGLIIYSIGFYFLVNSLSGNEKLIQSDYVTNIPFEEIENIKINKNESFEEGLEKSLEYFYSLDFEIKKIRTDEINEDHFVYPNPNGIDVPGTVYLFDSNINQEYIKPNNYLILTPEIVAKNLTKNVKLGYSSNNLILGEKPSAGTNVITVRAADTIDQYRVISFSDFYKTQDVENCNEVSGPGGSICKKVTDITLHIFISDPLDIPINSNLDFSNI